MNTKQAILIVSVYRSDRTEALNQATHLTTSSLLEKMGIEHAGCEGSYTHLDGTRVSEQSLVFPWSPDNDELVGKLAIDYEQESYLIVDANGLAALMRPDGSHLTELGKWTEVSEEVAEQASGYTRFLDRYYVTR